MSENENKKKPDPTSLYERDRAYKDTLNRTRSPYKAVKSYAAGNKWATENAKGVGNWKESKDGD